MKKIIKDIDGNEYPICRFGDQIWMAANLKVRHFRNGDPIQECSDSQAYSLAGQKGQPAWCYYNNQEENGKIYGALYNWFAAHDPRGIAPEGWRIPTEKDWAALESYSQLNPQPSSLLKDPSYWGMKELRQTNSFNALPGGSRGINGAFGGLGVNGYWWSYISNPPELSWGRKITKTHNKLEQIDSFQRFGFSIRCIKETLR